MRAINRGIIPPAPDKPHLTPIPPPLPIPLRSTPTSLCTISVPGRAYRPHAPTNTHTHTHTHAHAHTCTHARTHLHPRTHARTHQHTHHHTHARAHTLTRTRTVGLPIHYIPSGHKTVSYMIMNVTSRQRSPPGTALRQISVPQGPRFDSGVRSLRAPLMEGAQKPPPAPSPPSQSQSTTTYDLAHQIDGCVWCRRPFNRQRPALDLDDEYHHHPW